MHHRLTAAMVQAVKHTHMLTEFNQILDHDHPGMRGEWTQLVCDWEEDPTKPCPYIVESTSKFTPLTHLASLLSYHYVGITVAAICKELEQHDMLVSELDDGQPANVADVFYEGMEIEEVQ